MRTARWSIGLAGSLGLLVALAALPAGVAPVSADPLHGSEGPRVEYVGQFVLSPTQGKPGTVVTATGTGLPPNAELSLVWHTVRASWVIRGAYREEFHGRTFQPLERPLRRVRTDAAGAFTTTFTVPEDFGFMHDVTVVQDGVIRNQAAFNVDMQVSISPTSGPPGTPIRIVAKGIGWQSMENSWMLLYDNRFTGWLSAVTTRGQATAVIPATGPPGTHVIQVIHGSLTFPYMNMQQSPRPERPQFAFRFTITPGPPVLPPPLAQQGLSPLRGRGAPPGGEPAVWTDLASGPVGAPVRLHGRALPPGQIAQVTWTTMVGNRVSGAGWADETAQVARGVVDAEGHLLIPFKVPDDLGGPHAVIVSVGGGPVARTTFTVTPSIIAVSPASGPPGTTFKVHLKGVGWTETANIYHVVYDNAYIGYACGFNSQGDVQVFLKATGEPGWHFIDLYPGIYKGRDVAGVQNFRIPQLTYALDHPGERLPAFRAAFLITK